MAYSHHKKAGNEGDVVKHVALLAAVQEEARSVTNRAFRYADLFAGYAHNPLALKGEWEKGARQIQIATDQLRSPHSKLYAQWFLTTPTLAGSAYPGSSSVAFQAASVVSANGVEVTAWDTGDLEYLSLASAWGASNAKHGSAAPKDPEVRNADFVFIDPPDNKRATWKAIKSFLDTSSKQALLVWLPVKLGTTDPNMGKLEDAKSARWRKEALELELKVVQVGWRNYGNGMGGCQLIYRLSQGASDALQAPMPVVPLRGVSADQGTRGPPAPRCRSWSPGPRWATR